MSSYQKKLFKIDEHIGIAIAGLAADARVLSKYMRNECMNHKFVYDSPMPVSRLVLKVADKAQICTQSYSKRPYGVGLLVSGYDVCSFLTIGWNKFFNVFVGPNWTSFVPNRSIWQLL